jgi:hypothetical protein
MRILNLSGWGDEVFLLFDDVTWDSESKYKMNGNVNSFDDRLDGKSLFTFKLYSSSSSEKMLGLKFGSGPTGKSSLSSVITRVIWRG